MEMDVFVAFEALMNFFLFLGVAFCVIIGIGFVLTKSFKFLFIETAFGYFAFGVAVVVKAVLSLFGKG